jgi:hypothetical protein
MIEIPLTKGYVAIVDDEDAHLAVFKWQARAVEGQPVYARRTDRSAGYPRGILLHRAVLGVTDPTISIDHHNGDGLDCRRGNLRVATRSQNQWNRGAPRSNKSGFKGVDWNAAMGKWRAKIRVNWKMHHCGYFEDPVAAAHAYDAAAIRLHGEFARLNFPGAGNSVCASPSSPDVRPSR